MSCAWREEKQQRKASEVRRRRLHALLSAKESKMEGKIAEEKEEKKMFMQSTSSKSPTSLMNVQKQKQKDQKQKIAVNSHFPARLPHTLPRTHTTTKPKTRHTKNGKSTRNDGRKLPPMPTNKRPTFVDAMEARSQERRDKRELRRLRYVAAEQQQQRYESWKTIVSTHIAPEAARAGRMLCRQKKVRMERQRKKLKKEKELQARQKWAAAVIRDAQSTVQKWGLEPWKVYVIAQRTRRSAVESMRWKTMVSSCFDHWSRAVRDAKRYVVVFFFFSLVLFKTISISFLQKFVQKFVQNYSNVDPISFCCY